MKKSVLVYAGPRGSGKTFNMQKFAEVRGIFLYRALWPILNEVRNAYWKYLVKDPEGVQYLFIDEYDLNDADANAWLHEISLQDIMVVVCFQSDTITPELVKTLPDSFRITRCGYMQKEVVHG
jgi:hypothetical protein